MISIFGTAPQSSAYVLVLAQRPLALACDRLSPSPWSYGFMS